MTQQVDVLLPAFNCERTIASSVRSVLRQSFSALRLIVIDDGSTDSTAEILHELAASDRRMIVVRKDNAGIVEALNAGLALCRASLVARQDADDISYPHRFELQVRYLAENPDCVAVSGNALHIDAGGRRIGATHGSGDAIGHPYAIPAIEPHLLHPFLMTRLDCMRQVGGYRHVLHAEDVDLYWRLEPLGRMHVLEDRLGDYRIHSESLTSGSVRGVRAAAIFSQLAALSARRRSGDRPEIAFSAEFEKRVIGAASLAGMIAVAEKQLDPEEREYLQLSAAIRMIQSRIFRKFHFAGSDLRTICRILWRHRARLGPKEKRIILQAPFWYYYKPRAYLACLSALLRLPTGKRSIDAAGAQ